MNSVASATLDGHVEPPAHRARARQRIALVMIARDEARCIERCLTSVRPWVDEMVVLDTGSADATPDIAARCGARVHRFEWIEDFSAARNAALALTQAEWRLVIDADEWLVDGAGGLTELRELPGDFVGQVNVTSLVQHADAQAPSWLPRVLPRGVRYSGRIHEQPDLAWRRRRLRLVFAHDGYLPAQMAAKAGRNRRLLLRELGEQPDNAYLNYQLGKEFEVRARFAQAAPYYRHAYALTESPAAVPWWHDLVVRWLFTLKQLGGFDEALSVAQAQRERLCDSPDFHFTLGDLWLECALRHPRRAIELLPSIEASWLRAIEVGERPDLPDTVRGRGSFLAAHNLAVFHGSLGRADLERHWRHQVKAMRAGAPAAAVDLPGREGAVRAFAGAPVP